MSEMKLQFSFMGEVDGELDIWLNRPQLFRSEGSYRFGLGVSAMQQTSAVNSDFCTVSFVSFQLLLFFMTY
jgi:hypothetical protein